MNPFELRMCQRKLKYDLPMTSFLIKCNKINEGVGCYDEIPINYSAVSPNSSHFKFFVISLVSICCWLNLSFIDPIFSDLSTRRMYLSHFHVLICWIRESCVISLIWFVFCECHAPSHISQLYGTCSPTKQWRKKNSPETWPKSWAYHLLSFRWQNW